jgi:hypothetical protein
MSAQQNRILYINDESTCLVSKDWLVRMLQEKKVLELKMARANADLHEIKAIYDDLLFNKAIDDFLKDAAPANNLSRWRMELVEDAATAPPPCTTTPAPEAPRPATRTRRKQKRTGFVKTAPSVSPKKKSKPSTRPKRKPRN